MEIRDGGHPERSSFRSLKASPLQGSPYSASCFLGASCQPTAQLTVLPPRKSGEGKLAVPAFPNSALAPPPAKMPWGKKKDQFPSLSELSLAADQLAIGRLQSTAASCQALGFCIKGNSFKTSFPKLFPCLLPSLDRFIQVWPHH